MDSADDSLRMGRVERVGGRKLVALEWPRDSCGTGGVGKG